MLTKINTSKYKSKVFGENPHWKVQKYVFFSHIGQIRPENITIVQKWSSGAMIQVNHIDAHNKKPI